MYRKNYLFWDFEQLGNLINAGELCPKENYFICVHSATHTKNEAAEIVSRLAEMFPNSKIAGTSANDIIYMGRLYNDKCLISFMGMENTSVKVRSFSFEGKDPYDLAKEIYAEMCGSDTSLMLNFFSGYYEDMSDYVSAFDSISEGIKLAGGQASDIIRISEPHYAFTADGMCDNSVIAVSFDNEQLISSVFSMNGCEPVGDYYTVTKAEDNEIKEIDNIPAADWFKTLLGTDKLNAGDNDWENDALLRFPLVTDINGASRYVRYDRKSNSIVQYNIKCHNGMKFRISYQSALHIADQCMKICEKVNETPCEVIFCYSCLLRKLCFDNCAEWELRPFAEVGICGALLSGEIGVTEGHYEFLDGSCNIITLAEKEKYIHISDTVFANADKTDRFDLIYNSILRRQNEYMHNKNQLLMDEIAKQEAAVNDKIFKDELTGRDNITKYIYDNKDGIYDKCCLVTIEKGDVAIGHFSHEEYASILNENIDHMQSFLAENYSALRSRIYIFDSCSFIIACENDADCEQFVKASEELFAKFGTVSIPKYNYSCINHFIVVAGEKNALDKIKITKVDSLKSLERFVVYDSSKGIEHEIEESMKTVDLINYAIRNDTVIPYFQPIYDNQTGKIDKFEALMRIKGPDGKIYFPGDFMKAAKEYRLYLQISKIMINKVFDLFESRSETVSINLSAYDINSSEIRGMIYERLERIGDAKNFIFEVLESEEFRDVDVLKHFIANVRRHNVRIAIDDFGAGFTNLLEIAQLSPNYIKIDGQIVREVVDSEMHRKIVGTILYLANSFDIDLIAEYIENEALQDYASNKGVRYSQGYYFSKAVPFSELDSIEKQLVK